MSKLKVLAMSGKEAAEKFWPEEQIIVPDWNVYNPPASEASRYDVIHAHFLLQRVLNADVDSCVEKWVRILKPGGELHINVPALEWVAEQIQSGNPSPLLLVHIFGPQVDDKFWMSGFTMSRLRQICLKLALDVKMARTYGYGFMFNEEEFKAKQHHLIAVKT